MTEEEIENRMVGVFVYAQRMSWSMPFVSSFVVTMPLWQSKSFFVHSLPFQASTPAQHSVLRPLFSLTRYSHAFLCLPVILVQEHTRTLSQHVLRPIHITDDCPRNLSNPFHSQVTGNNIHLIPEQYIKPSSDCLGFLSNLPKTHHDGFRPAHCGIKHPRFHPSGLHEALRHGQLGSSPLSSDTTE